MATNTRNRVVPPLVRMKSQKKPPKNEEFTLVATNPAYLELCKQSVRRLAPAFRAGASVCAVSPTGPVAAKVGGESVVVISRLADLTDEMLKKLSVSNESRQLVFISGFPVEGVTSRLMKLRIRRPDRLHLAADSDIASESRLIQRLVSGMAENDGSKTIVDAWVEGDNLVLLSPSFDRMTVPCSRVARFLGDNDSKCAKFEIDEDGRFLYWPHSDTHLGWKQLEQLINPAVAIKDKEKNDQFRRRYGQAIKSLREDTGLKQKEIHGLTDRQLRRIEQGEQIVTSKALEALAKSHGMEIGDYMRELGRRTAKN